MAEADNESENFFHLVKLIVDVGSEVLRDVLLHIIKPDTLDNVLQNNMSTINSLQRQRILFVNEYNVLTEKPPNSDKFDITLLVKILRNLCPSICPNVISPNYVWKKLPGPNDFRLEDDIQRLREIRNAIFAHIPNAKVTDNEFQKHWVNITDAITRAAVYGSPGMKQRVKDKIKTIRTENFKSSSLENLVEVFRAWYEEDKKEFEKQLKQQGDETKAMSEQVTQLDTKVQGLDEKVREIDANLPSISEKQSITDTEKSQLRQYLIDGYKQKLEVTILPQWEQLPVSEIFTPSILVCVKENKAHNEDEFINLETYRQLFYKNDVLQKRVILLGKTGTGKTTFSKHLTDAWCETTTQSLTQFADVDVLKKFRYLFYVSCRFAEEKETLLDMINNQLFNDDRMKEVALYMLQNYPECCLIVLDGADELKGSPTSETGRRGDMTGLPGMTGVDGSVILITSRPWRFHALPKKTKDIFRRLEINGVKNVKNLAVCILKNLKDPAPEESTKDFMHQVTEKNILELMEIPLILIISLGGWIDDKSLHRSITLNYINMILSFIRRLKGQGNWPKGKLQQLSKLETLESEWEQKADELPELLMRYKPFKRYAGLFLSLGQLASNLLLEKEGQSLVFSKEVLKKYCLADEEDDDSVKVCLALGILSKTETTTRGIKKLESYVFCHKTFQEFFAALWLASKHSNENSKLYKCIKSYSDLMSYEILIRFLCGLDPEAGKLFWKFIAEEDQVVKEEQESVWYPYYKRMKELTALVCNCMKERGCDPKYQKSDQIYFCIPLIGIDRSTSDEDMIRLRNVMEKYPDNVKSLALTNRTMTNLLLPVEGTRMASLKLNDVTMTHHGCEQLAESLLSYSSLENLDLYRVRCRDHDGGCCIPVLDLQKHNKLETLWLWNLSVAGLLLPVGRAGITLLKLRDVTMTHHGCEQLAKSLLSCSSLKTLDLHEVRCRDLDGACCIPVLDLQKHNKLTKLWLLNLSVEGLLLPVGRTSITLLDLHDVTMTHHGCEQLAESLLSNSSLEDLVLHSVRCRDHDGGCCIPVLDLQKHNKLETLELYDLSVEGLLLPVGRASITSLDLHDVTMTMTHYGCEQLAKSLLSYSESKKRHRFIIRVKCREHSDCTCQTVEDVNKL